MDESTATDGDEIDPAWWSQVLDGIDPFEKPELLSLEFEGRLKQDGLGDRERQVVEALAVVTSAMLAPESWQEPFRPAIVWDGHRSPLPADLTPEQVALLRRIAPTIEHASLRARVADVAWFYGDRGASDLLDIAVDTYRSFPLDRQHWARSSEEAWQRALQLAKRLGRRRTEVMAALGDSMRDVILRADADDGFLTTQISQLLGKAVRVPGDTARQLAEHLVGLAAEVKMYNPRLSRHLERQAAAWFGRCGANASATDCSARVAETYIAAADARLAADESSALAATFEIERAIATIRTLPRSYRKTHGLDARLEELRHRLEDLRHATLEAMVTVESEPVDLTRYARQAQAAVSGRGPLEALVCFANLVPLASRDEMFDQARELASGSISALLQRATYSSDGRKIATSGGIDDDDYLWTQVVRDFRHRVGLTTSGLILPARERLLAEHRYPLRFLMDICLDAPLIPPRHERLWARGLWHGVNDDFPSAVSVLVPQAEQAIRFQLKRVGVNTLFTDEATGVETEKGLGTLLAQDGIEEHFGRDLTLELRALLTEQEGANLRNEIAHGLLDDDASWSSSAIYCWWLLLRLVVTPVWRMRQSEVDEP
ncbi:DUF4209 domain-containing protein [Kribbella sandramycini]|uniref:DUF4209 domain-containing protein n=1 Tax=Kribbella sandramycini TaxID=60450 RepID=A0A7Y4L3E0_9ACTN|nr:hypothetical protein [Kribbella sandramycini]NOL42701.1 DUF4209 domain-containing protein [Kribbella sandramycini]